MIRAVGLSARTCPPRSPGLAARRRTGAPARVDTRRPSSILPPMRLIACTFLLGLALSLPSGCVATNCADGDCGASTDTSPPSTSDASTSSNSTTDTPTGTTAEPTGTGSASSTTGEPGTSTSTTDEPGTSTSTTGEPGSTGGTTGGAAGEPTKMEPACAPDDGPATEFKIGVAARECSADFPEDAPLFRIVIFTAGPPLPPAVYKLDGGQGFAFFDDGNGVKQADVGTLTITELTADGALGTYDVTFQDNSALAGEFDAIFCDSDILCG